MPRIESRDGLGRIAKIPIGKRFWHKTKRSGECLIWQGKTNKDGYGKVWWSGKEHRAHRVSFELAYSLPGKENVLHRCDRPACVRPAHLYLGSQSDNVQDEIKRDRNPVLRRGFRHKFSKFSINDIKSIRSLKGLKTQREIAELYRCSQQTISKIILRKRYA